jgi:methionine aminopeptidase
MSIESADDLRGLPHRFPGFTCISVNEAIADEEHTIVVRREGPLVLTAA